MKILIDLLGGVRASIFALLFVVAVACFGVKSCQYESYKAEVATANKKAEKIAKAKEDGWKQGIDAAMKEYAEKRNTREEALRVTIDELRSGDVRVRPRLQCVSKTPDAPAGDNAGEEGGLRREDVEFLLREASRADAYTEQLQACQAYVKELHK